MDIERLRALEKRLRDDANGGAGYSTTAYEDGRIAEKLKCADELATLIAELGQEVAPVSAPEGWALVPKQMALTPEALGLIETMCAGPDNEGIGGEGGEDRWVDGLLWVGETIGDDGEKYWGLNIACAECLDEGSLPIFEFDRPTSPAHTSEARDAEVAELIEATRRLTADIEFRIDDPRSQLLDRARRATTAAVGCNCPGSAKVSYLSHAPNCPAREALGKFAAMRQEGGNV